MQIPISTVGNPPSSKPIYDALLLFLNEVLPKFEPYNEKGGKVVESEDDITVDLSWYLDSLQEEARLVSYLNKNEQNDIFYFKFINQDHKADISVKLGRGYKRDNCKSICWIEAKRLPTPSNNKRDEREYVYVDKNTYRGGGGIQRYKLNKHGKYLPISIIIGYIQNHDSLFWHRQINEWIQELINLEPEIWTTDDILMRYHPQSSNRYISKHKRINNENGEESYPILLHHFWITINHT